MIQETGARVLELFRAESRVSRSLRTRRRSGLLSLLHRVRGRTPSCKPKITKLNKMCIDRWWYKCWSKRNIPIEFEWTSVVERRIVSRYCFEPGDCEPCLNFMALEAKGQSSTDFVILESQRSIFLSCYKDLFIYKSDILDISEFPSQPRPQGESTRCPQL